MVGTNTHIAAECPRLSLNEFLSSWGVGEWDPGEAGWGLLRPIGGKEGQKQGRDFKIFNK